MRKITHDLLQWIVIALGFVLALLLNNLIVSIAIALCALWCAGRWAVEMIDLKRKKR
jgi:hypothetical protein